MKEENEIPAGNLYIAKTIAGLEEILASELTSLGAQDIQILSRAVSFRGDARILYKANYSCRTALRILVQLFTFQLADEDDLYSNIFDYPWEDLFEVTNTLSVDAVVNNSELTHSHYVALRTKDAIVDRFREHNNGRRPSVDTDDPDFRINIHINGSICDVSLDSSGASLHKRGYRVSNAEAPMSEVLAAGLILLSGWDKKSHFIDPMCGSGTLLIEAALIANNMAPGQYRKSYGFMRFKDFSQELWDEIIAEAIDQEVEFEYEIIGNDLSPKALSASRNNIKSARLHKDIQLVEGPFSVLKPPAGEPGIVMINPPYGERIKTNNIIGLYKEIGDTLKNEFTGYKAWVISSDHYAIKFIGLRPSKKFTVWNGPLECRYVGFDLYRGTRRVFEPGEQEEEENEEMVKYPLRREERDDEANRPPEREPRSTRPFQRAERADRPFSREKREERTDKPFQREDRTDRPFSREKREGSERPFKREEQPDKPFQRDDRTDKPFSREKREGSERPFKREEQPDKPFQRDGRTDRPYSREKRDGTDRPFRREDGPDKATPREDQKDRPFSREKKEGTDRPFKREDRSDKPFRREEQKDRPFSREKKEGADRPFKREDRADKPYVKGEGDGNSPRSREMKPPTIIEEYLPQNRFEKPEKTYRRIDGRANTGNPSGDTLKPKKEPRPRKPRNDED